jgi:tyrosinase
MVLGSLPLRREVRDLEANFPDQFNLFILAMSRMQRKSKDDPQSYFQITGESIRISPTLGRVLTRMKGIHGMPYKVWNNAKGISDFQFGGYCTHSSILFVPWHRPFLALFEVTCPVGPT